MADEIERRWLVRDVDLDLAALPSKRIAQAYVQTPAEENLRVRIIDDTRAVITYKTGTGLVRDEFERTLPLATARGLYERFPLKIEKRRHLHDGYEIDVYEGPLAGLIIVEREQKSLDDERPVPDWMLGAVEVTDSVNNVVLARLSKLLVMDRAKDTPLYAMLLPRSVRVIVLTGGPGSGKSTAMEALREDPEIGPNAHFVPEIASFIIAQVGLKPPNQERDPVGFAGFQQLIAGVQLLVEDGAVEQATRDGKPLVILDRALFDGAAYLEGGLEELNRITRFDLGAMGKRYSRVIQLEVAPPDVYEGIRKNNPARSESHAKAFLLSNRIRDAWRLHPSHALIVNGTGWKEKYARVREIVHHTLKSI